MLLPFLESSNSQTTGVPDITDSNKNGQIKLPTIKIPTFTRNGTRHAPQTRNVLLHRNRVPRI